MNISKIKNVDGMVGEGVGFERIRRITGYLVGTLDRFNDGKRAEVEDRVQHGFGGSSVPWMRRSFLRILSCIIVLKWLNIIIEDSWLHIRGILTFSETDSGS